MLPRMPWCEEKRKAAALADQAWRDFLRNSVEQEKDKMSTDKRIHDDVKLFVELVDKMSPLYNETSVHVLVAAVRFALDAEAARPVVTSGETVVGEHYERQRLKLWDEAREVIIDGKVYKSNRNDCVPRPAEKITREQVSRCLMRAGVMNRPVVQDAIDNIMELIDGSR